MLVSKNLGLIKAIHSGASAPSNIQMLWYNTGDNKHYAYNTSNTTWEILQGVDSFLGLSDTPNGFAGSAGFVVKVNSTEDGLEFSASTGITSVNGNSGPSVTLDTDDIDEGSTNLYYTNVRADGRITAQKGNANGLATLDGSGKIPNSQLPPLAITSSTVVADIPARDALTPQEGDVAIVTSTSKSYIYNGSTWLELLTPTDTVLSVNGQTGVVSLDSDDILEGTTNLFYTDQRAIDALTINGVENSLVRFGATGNTFEESGIYDDGTFIGVGVNTAFDASINFQVASNSYFQEKLNIGTSSTIVSDNNVIFGVSTTASGNILFKKGSGSPEIASYQDDASTLGDLILRTSNLNIFDGKVNINGTTSNAMLNIVGSGSSNSSLSLYIEDSTGNPKLALNDFGTLLINNASNDDSYKLINNGSTWLQSGTTYISGNSTADTDFALKVGDVSSNIFFQVRNDGKIVYTDGSQTNGFVLSTDSSGVATWVNPTSVIDTSIPISINKIPKGNATSDNIIDGSWSFQNNDIYPQVDGSNIGGSSNKVGTMYMSGSSVIDYSGDLSIIKSGNTYLKLTSTGKTAINGSAGTAQLHILTDSNTTAGAFKITNSDSLDTILIRDNGKSEFKTDATGEIWSFFSSASEARLSVDGFDEGVIALKSSGTTGISLHAASTTSYLKIQSLDFSIRNASNSPIVTFDNVDLKFSYTDGSEGLDKVLSSDASGVATWVDVNTLVDTTLPITTNYIPKGNATSDSIEDGTWAFSGNDLYPITDGANIGLTGTNRVGTIFMSSIIDFSTHLAFNESGTEIARFDSGKLGIGTTILDFDLSFSGNASKQIGSVRHTTTASAGNNLTIQAGGSTVSGTNLSGGNLILRSGQSTGTGTSFISWELPTLGGSVSADGVYTERARLLSTGFFGLGGTPTSIFEGFTSNTNDKFRFGTNLRSVFGGATGMGMEFSAPNGDGYGYCGIYQRSYGMNLVSDAGFKFGTSPGSSTPQCEFNFTGGVTQPRYHFGMGDAYDMDDSMFRINQSKTSAASPTYATSITNKRSGTTSASGAKIVVDGVNTNNNTGLLINVTGNTTANYGILVQNGDSGFGTITPTARLHIKGSGSTSATSSLKVENSSSTLLFNLKDNGDLDLTGNFNISEGSSIKIAGNKFIHYTSAFTSVTGYCTFFGYNSGLSNTALNNSSFGSGALKNNIAASANTANGVQSLESQVSGGGNNSAFGAFSGQQSTGQWNVFNGAYSGYTSGSQSFSVGIGAQCFDGGTITGSDSIAIGYRSGRHLTGAAARTISIGSFAGFGASNSFTDTISIGTEAACDKSNQVVIGGVGGNQYYDEFILGSNKTTGTGALTKFTLSIKTGGNSYNTNTNCAGNDLLFAAGQARGNGTASGFATKGDIIWQTTELGVSGTTLQALTTRMSLKAGTGNLVLGSTTSNDVAILELVSTTKGFLPSRMTGTQAEAITAVEGLLVYSTDGSGSTITSKGWWGYEGATWVKLN